MAVHFTCTVESIAVQTIASVTGAAKVALSVGTRMFTSSIVDEALIDIYRKDKSIDKYIVIHLTKYVTRAVESIAVQFIASVTGAAKVSLSVGTGVFTVSIVSQALIDV